MATVPILNSSDSVEWYTPAPYVEAARDVLGGIELDPASCLEAQQVVKADRWFGQYTSGTLNGNTTTRYTDGLKHPWVAQSVFHNPPYGADGQRTWSHRLLRFYQQAQVGAAILLVNAATSETWFRPFWQFPIAFPDHRIKFNYPKLRRFSWHSIAGDKEKHDKLIKVPVRVWNDKKRGWLSHTGKVIKIEENAPVYNFGDAWHMLNNLRNDDGPIYFDRMDKPAQPTKGQAFVFMPDLLEFRRGLTNSAHIDERAWLSNPAIAGFIGNFSQFGHIYLPTTIALHARDLAQSRKAKAA